MHCIMRQVDPVQPILLGEGVRGCRNCMLSITKQRMLISIRVYSELSVTIEIKCISSKQMTWKKIHFFESEMPLSAFQGKCLVMHSQVVQQA